MSNVLHYMDVVISVSIVGVSASLFLGTLFLFNRESTANLFLGIFFVLLAIKIGKLSVLEYGPSQVQLIYFNLMHAAYLAMGPVILLYIRSYALASQTNWKKQLYHFLPSLTLLIGATQLRTVLGEEWWIRIYWVTLFHPVSYSIFTWLYVRRRASRITSGQQVWLTSLLTAVLFIAIINILFFVSNFPFYVVTAGLLLITTYLFTYMAFNNRAKILLGKSDLKYKNLNLSEDKLFELQSKIDELLVRDELYLDHHVKLSSVSERLNTSPHVVSMVINDLKSQSFRDYINSLRIAHAQQKIIDEKDAKIISVALESGFSSLSAFNRAFKKVTRLNPSEFRARHFGKNAS